MEEWKWPKRTVKLDNDLGVLTIRLPDEFDTFYYFDKVYDYGCDEKIFRFQQKRFPSLNEFWHNFILIRTDSLYHFTISHLLGKDCVSIEQIDSNCLKKSATYYSLHEIISNTNPIQWQIKKIEIINGIKYAVLADTRERSEFLKEEVFPLKNQTLIAKTFINNEFIELQFTCAASNCDSFIPKMYKALRTVEIKPN